MSNIDDDGSYKSSQLQDDRTNNRRCINETRRPPPESRCPRMVLEKRPFHADYSFHKERTTHFFTLSSHFNEPSAGHYPLTPYIELVHTLHSLIIIIVPPLKAATKNTCWVIVPTVYTYNPLTPAYPPLTLIQNGRRYTYQQCIQQFNLNQLKGPQPALGILFFGVDSSSDALIKYKLTVINQCL